MRGILPSMKAEVLDLGFGEESKRRDRDIEILEALVGEPEDLTSEQHEAFSEMLDKLRTGRQKVLSEKQRAWAEGIAEKLELDVGDPAERNANVPRGREVEPAPVLKNLPKRPPRKRIEDPDFDYEK